MAFEEAEKSEDPAERSCPADVRHRRRRPDRLRDGGRPARDRPPRHAPRIPKHRHRRHEGDFGQAGPRILPTFPEDLAARAKKNLEALGVEVGVGARVVNIEPMPSTSTAAIASGRGPSSGPRKPIIPNCSGSSARRSTGLAASSSSRTCPYPATPTSSLPAIWPLT